MHIVSSKPAQRNTLDELEMLGDCLKAISDLMCPDLALDGNNRDHLSILLDYLLCQQQACHERLRSATS